MSLRAPEVSKQVSTAGSDILDYGTNELQLNFHILINMESPFISRLVIFIFNIFDIFYVIF